MRRYTTTVLAVVGLLALGFAVAIRSSIVTPVAAVMAGVSVVGLFLCTHAWQKAADRWTAGLSASQPPAAVGPLEPLACAVRSSLIDLNEKLHAAQTRIGDMNLRLQLVQQRKSSVEAILHSIRDVVIVIDDCDRIVLANDAAEKLFCFRFDPNGSMPAANVLADQGLLSLIQKSRSGRIAHVRHEIAFQRSHGQVIFDAVLSCVDDDSGRLCAVVAVLHDITREKEIAQMKNDFVSHVSHELKTPLASINAYAEMLVDDEAKDEKTLKQFCSVIQGQAQRLTRLIEDILNISRIESGLIKVRKEHHSMAMIIRDAVQMITSYAQEKNLTVNAQAPILYDQVYIDRDMLSQVVINLLSNAVKYTPAGGSVTIGSEVCEADNRITVTVSDTGVGIPPEAVEHVFDKFYRVEENNKYAKGTGLGLNLVKQIVETVHGGRVFVTSTVGKGSTFGFELPLASEAVYS
jgi:two-component system phosphate regulon sensor histidine kinase PhoR